MQRAKLFEKFKKLLSNIVPQSFDELKTFDTKIFELSFENYPTQFRNCAPYFWESLVFWGLFFLGGWGNVFEYSHTLQPLDSFCVYRIVLYTSARFMLKSWHWNLTQRFMLASIRRISPPFNKPPSKIWKFEVYEQSSKLEGIAFSEKKISVFSTAELFQKKSPISPPFYITGFWNFCGGLFA